MSNSIQINGCGKRFNTNKPSFKSIPPRFLLALAEHATKGAVKYPDDEDTGQPNWTKGMKYTFVSDCAQRHLQAWLSGEVNDSDLDSHHLIAAIWNLMALYHYDTNVEYAQFDDRPYKE